MSGFCLVMEFYRGGSATIKATTSGLKVLHSIISCQTKDTIWTTLVDHQNKCCQAISNQGQSMCLSFGQIVAGMTNYPSLIIIEALFLVHL